MIREVQYSRSIRKAMNHLFNLLPLPFFILLNCGTCILSKRSFGKTLSLSLMVSVYILFTGQLIFGTFSYAFYLICILAAVNLVLIFTLNNGWKENKEYILTDGFYAFIAIFLMYFFIDAGRKLRYYDELMHWGKMVKEMIRLDQFYCVEGSGLFIHKEYPPFIQLFELLWCKIIGRYSESGITMAINIFQCSMLLPFLAEKLSKPMNGFKKWITWIGGTFFFIAVLAFFDREMWFQSLYPDVLIALVFAYSMILIKSRDAFTDSIGFVSYTLSLVTILYIKQIGIALVMVSLAYFMFISIWGQNESAKIKGIRIMIAVCAAILSYGIWQSVIAPYHFETQFDIAGKASLKTFREYLFGSGLQHDTISAFFTAVFEKNITASILPITFISSSLAAIAVIALIRHYRPEKFPGREDIFLELLLGCSSAAYALLILVIFTFCMPKVEMVELNCFPRYMGTWVVGEWIFILLAALDAFAKEITEWISPKRILLIAFAVAALLIPAGMLRFAPQIIRGDPRKEYRLIASEIEAKTPPNSQVYLLDHSSDTPAMISYYTETVQIENSRTILTDIDPSDYPSVINGINFLLHNDYLYTLDVTPNFNESFAVYNNGKDFENNRLYKILWDNNGIAFEEIP